MFTPKHTPQPYTQKLLNLGIIEFSNTISNCNEEPGDSECYKVTADYIIGVDSECLNCGIPTICTYSEIYNDKDKFINILCSFCEDLDEGEVLPNELKIYKLMEV